MSLIITENLTISRSKKQICNQLNWSISAGEMWGILGPNGAGKTTFLHTLAHLLPPISGKIWLKKSPIDTLSRREIAQQIGVLFQSANDYFPQTVTEFCASGRFPHHTFLQKKSLADDIILNDSLRAMQLDSLKLRLMNSLSGGEKRRAAIAALLTQTPSLYLLDEPTNHLDLPHQLATLAHFQSLARTKQKAVVMSLHDINHVQTYCDHVLMLYPNGALLQGATSEMLTETNLTELYQHPIRAIYDDQRIFWQPR